MAVYDVTLPLRPEHPPWPGDPLFCCDPIGAISKGDSCNVSRLEMSSHFGTHVDAPYHFESDGARLDEISLDVLMGRAFVCQVNASSVIGLDDLPNLDGVERILFKTFNSRFIGDTEFHTDYVSVGLDAARRLVEGGVKLVGLDYFSIEAFKAPGHPVHHELCGRGVILLEGIDLRRVDPGWYELIALPLKVAGGDGSPCRVVLRDLK